ncbi:MAG: hypothetical protein D6694_12805 [Gammaproteobacteria bacterium]|nr:MAG: hypothetical protein D6694_12805 [Gammaproteobacteria bacterium]
MAAGVAFSSPDGKTIQQINEEARRKQKEQQQLDFKNSFNQIQGLVSPLVGQPPSTGDGLSLSDLAKQATEGSIQSFDRAANRLRERLESQSAAAKDTLLSQNLGRGLGASGLTAQGLTNLELGKLGALSDGLVGLESQFERSRLQGIQEAINALQSQHSSDLDFRKLLVNSIINLLLGAKGIDANILAAASKVGSF